ncbi:hypothetical protein RB620_24825 [Paenibacillus sp. LHD-117]|uniref:hypothetical protein n=1 Tax=Paenibacillus sp. LHD-117 TaxID=3071412 RepID=UPI0027E173C0|nr:hypothetical protein [Paenibacillus sp. LHD-117]MDQ6422662.1 hypothetical protein [Paenibacillus sp. LHD-117]
MNESVWGIGDFASLVGKHANTVDGWFKKLEEKGLHCVIRVNGEKVYDELDLRVAQYICEKRNNSGGRTAWTLDAIFIELPNVLELRPFPQGTDPKDTQILDYHAFQELLTREFQEREHRLFQMVDEVVSKRMQELASIIKHQRIEESRWERKLRQEALKSWDEQPAKVRFKREGLFSKVENVVAKERFIKMFVESHQEQNS